MQTTMAQQKMILNLVLPKMHLNLCILKLNLTVQTTSVATNIIAPTAF